MYLSSNAEHSMGESMKEGNVYLKLEQSVQVSNKRITLEDIAEIYAWDYSVTKELGQIVVLTVKGDKNEKNVISALKLINLMQKQFPGINIDHIGEPDLIVEYRMPVTDNKLLEGIKLVILSLIVFFGSAFTIMTFNTDVSVGEVFDLVYELVMQKPNTDGSILEIAYSLGIPIGILGFYNHFKVRKAKEDPTPVHVEMRNYEEEMNKAIIADASREGSELQ